MDSRFSDWFLAVDQAPLQQQVLSTLNLGVLVLLLLACCFALLAIAFRLQYSRRRRLWARLHELWDQQILDVLCGDSSTETFKPLVEPGQELNFIRFLAPFAYRLRGSDLGVLTTLARPHLAHAAGKLTDKDAGVRVWAVNVLSLFGMPEYEDEMLTALRDPSPVVAMFAAHALLAQKHAHYVEPVMEQFHRFDKWNLNSLAGMLASTGNAAMPIIERIFLDSSLPVRTRVVAAEVLNRFNDYDIADAAAALLETEQDRELVLATLRLLGGVGYDRHRAVVRQLCAAPDEIIRINALRTLRHLATLEDCELFRAALDDPNPWAARQAARALLTLGDTESLEDLIRAGHPRAALASQVLAGKDRG